MAPQILEARSRARQGVVFALPNRLLHGSNVWKGPYGVLVFWVVEDEHGSLAWGSPSSSIASDYRPSEVDRIWGIWGSYYDMPKGMFYGDLLIVYAKPCSIY